MTNQALATPTIEELCQQSIRAYLDVKGIAYQQEGAYLRLKDHDSLVVDTRITPGKSYETFYWNSQGVGGNLYNFLQAYMGLDKKQTIEELKALNPQLATQPRHEQPTKPYRPQDWQASKSTARVKAYLTQVRKLDPQLVDLLIQKQLLRQLKSGDAFFSWRNAEGKEVGGDVQGTYVSHKKYGKRGTLKRVAVGSQKNLGFHFNYGSRGSEQSKLYVFESPIDALSYFQMHGFKQEGDKRFLSLNGAGTKVKTIVHFMQREHFYPKELHLAFDTDEAGIKGAKKANELIQELGTAYKQFRDMRVIVDQPAAGIKDWNEALQRGDSNLKQLDYLAFEAAKVFDQPKQDKQQSLVKHRQLTR